MVRRCYVCKLYPNKDKTMSFHRLPRESIRRRIWMSALGFEENQKFPKRVDICCNHFEKSDFHYIDKNKRLRTDAVPILNHSCFLENIDTDSTPIPVLPKALKIIACDSSVEKSPVNREHYMTVSSRNILSSAWESSSRATKQDKTNKLLSPSNSHIKSEEIEIDEIKLDTIDTQNEYNISNTIYLSNFYGVKTECKDPIKSETEIKVLSETVHNIKQEIDIKCEEIEIGGIKVEPLDPADDYYFLNN